MIRNFADHSANERTYLAWVRTSVAILGFGFVVERLGVIGTPTATGSQTGVSYTGALLMVTGVLLIITASVRFILTRRRLDSETVLETPAGAVNLLLAVALVLLAASLLIYAAHVSLR